MDVSTTYWQHLEFTISEYFLIASNAVAIIGVLFWKWDISSILLIYWTESIIIGLFNILKMFKVGGVMAIYLVIFFTIHYGLFMVGHLVFILGILSTIHTGNHKEPIGFAVLPLLRSVWPAVASIAISHGVSYYVNFLGKKEYEHKEVKDFFVQPYGRVVFMHVTLLFGIFLSSLFKEPTAIIIFFIILKTIVDLTAHRKQREQSSPQESLVQAASL